MAEVYFFFCYGNNVFNIHIIFTYGYFFAFYKLNWSYGLLFQDKCRIEIGYTV